MSENEIKPAMTPEEWAAHSDEGPVDGYIDWDAGVVDVNNHYVQEPERFRHALAALALHGQPFGFTWADVDLLMRVSDSDDFWGDRRYDDLADRIASLLPPREPESKP